MFTLIENQTLRELRKRKARRRDYKAILAVCEYHTTTKSLEVTRGEINAISGMNLNGNDWRVVKNALIKILPKEMKVRD